MEDKHAINPDEVVANLIKHIKTLENQTDDNAIEFKGKLNVLKKSLDIYFDAVSKNSEDRYQKIIPVIINNTKEVLSELTDASIDKNPILKNAINELFTTLERLNNIINSSSFISNLDHLFLPPKYDDQLKHYEYLSKLLSEKDTQIKNLSISIDQLEDEFKVQLKKAYDIYNSGLEEIQQKQKEIDELLGHAAGKTLAGDHEQSAKDENISANWFRFFSILCMGASICLVAIAFHESFMLDFSWQDSLFRIVLAFMLSIPAAYLARESSKHREQQYAYQQTSLDLKAIAPYIADLPEEEKHKIKISIAEKLFASRDFSRVSKDPYPINSHELLMKLIDKLELKKEK